MISCKGTIITMEIYINKYILLIEYKHMYTTLTIQYDTIIKLDTI